MASKPKRNADRLEPAREQILATIQLLAADPPLSPAAIDCLLQALRELERPGDRPRTGAGHPAH